MAYYTNTCFHCGDHNFIGVFPKQRGEATGRELHLSTDRDVELFPERKPSKRVVGQITRYSYRYTEAIAANASQFKKIFPRTRWEDVRL